MKATTGNRSVLARSRGLRRLAPAALGVIAAATAIGCRGSPIDRAGERSQYDRHEAIRGQRAEPYIEDEFGRMIVNLRGRLLPKE